MGGTAGRMRLGTSLARLQSPRDLTSTSPFTSTPDAMCADTVSASPASAADARDVGFFAAVLFCAAWSMVLVLPSRCAFSSASLRSESDRTPPPSADAAAMLCSWGGPAMLDRCGLATLPPLGGTPRPCPASPRTPAGATSVFRTVPMAGSSPPGLAVFFGTACVDIILDVEAMPDEDTECRATGRTTRAGGNACNSAVVCGSMGHPAAWVGASVDPAVDPGADVCLAAMGDVGVDVAGATLRAHGAVPTSYIVSVRGGSRTIVHHRDLDELSASELRSGIERVLTSRPLGWVHCECRGDVRRDLVPTMRWLRSLKEGSAGRAACGFRWPVVTLELEKPRDGEMEAAAEADVIVVSGEWCRKRLPGAGPFDVVRSLIASHGPALSGRTSIVLTRGEGGCIVVPSVGDARDALKPRTGAPATHDTLPRLEASAARAAAWHQEPGAWGGGRRDDETGGAVVVGPVPLPEGWTMVGDSVGVGDSFAAGLAILALRDPAASITDAVQFASAVAAAKLGCRGLASVPEALARLAEAAR